MPSYKVSDVEGIGPKYSVKLKKIGVHTLKTLLDKGATRQGRKALSTQSGIDETYILKWVNMADLYRVKGIGSEYSELLEKAGVDTVKELRNRVPENLLAKMKEVNSKGRPLVRQLPGLKRVQAWVNEAKKLEPKVKY